jgi:hypothetical protein
MKSGTRTRVRRAHVAPNETPGRFTRTTGNKQTPGEKNKTFTFPFCAACAFAGGELYSELGSKTLGSKPLSLIELSVHPFPSKGAVLLGAATLEPVWQFVEGWVRPKIDVVLPPVESGGAEARLFVLAATEAAGAEAVQKVCWAA